MRFLDRLQPLGLLVLRLVLGAIMTVHGYHKIFGGMSHFVPTVAHLGLPAWMAYLSAGTEFFGGILLLVGLVTRCAALAVMIDMIVASGKFTGTMASWVREDTSSHSASPPSLSP